MIKIIFEIVGTIGGVGTIITALSGFLSKLWADTFMRKKIIEYDKQLEFYKNSLELEREKYIALNEQIIHKNQRIFDTEFEIYKEISPKIINAVNANDQWLINGRLEEENLAKLRRKYVDLDTTLSQYALFLDKEIYEILNKLCQSFLDLSYNIEIVESSKYKKYKDHNISDSEAQIIFLELHEKSNEINKMKDIAMTQIRDYLRKMAIIK